MSNINIISKPSSPGMENTQRLLGHAIDAPVGVSVIVADCYGESAIIRPYQLYDFPLLASNLQGLPFAGVGGLVSVILH